MGLWTLQKLSPAHEVPLMGACITGWCFEVKSLILPVRSSCRISSINRRSCWCKLVLGREGARSTDSGRKKKKRQFGYGHVSRVVFAHPWIGASSRTLYLKTILNLCSGVSVWLRKPPCLQETVESDWLHLTAQFHVISPQWICFWSRPPTILNFRETFPCCRFMTP